MNAWDWIIRNKSELSDDQFGFGLPQEDQPLYAVGPAAITPLAASPQVTSPAAPIPTPSPTPLWKDSKYNETKNSSGKTNRSSTGTSTTNKTSDTQQVTNNNKETTEGGNTISYKMQKNTPITRDPWQYRLATLAAMGMIPQYEHDESGAIKYEKNPVFDRYGRVVKYERGNPILSMEQNVSDPTHPYQQQLEGLKKYEAAASEMFNQEPRVDLSPLLALADSEFGSKLLPGYKRPESMEEKRRAALSYLGKIQDDRRDLLRSAAEGSKFFTSGSGSINELIAAMLNNKISNSTGAGTVNTQSQGGATTNDIKNTVESTSGTEQKSGAKNEVGTGLGRPFNQDTFAYRAHNQNVQATKNDPVLRDMFGRYQVVNNAISNLTNAHNLTPQQFHESQQAIRTTLFPKGVTSGVDERAKNYIESAGYNIDNLIQIISGKPASISQEDPDIRHIEELAANLKTNFSEGAKKRINFVTSGQNWIYSDPRYAHLYDSLQKLQEAGSDQFTPTKNAQGGLNLRAAPGATNVKSVNGATAIDGYDGSTPAPKDATEAQKKLRYNWLKQKEKRGGAN